MPYFINASQFFCGYSNLSAEFVGHICSRSCQPCFLLPHVSALCLPLFPPVHCDSGTLTAWHMAALSSLGAWLDWTTSLMTLGSRCYDKGGGRAACQHVAQKTGSIEKRHWCRKLHTTSPVSLLLAQGGSVHDEEEEESTASFRDERSLRSRPGGSILLTWCGILPTHATRTDSEFLGYCICYWQFCNCHWSIILYVFWKLLNRKKVEAFSLHACNRLLPYFTADQGRTSSMSDTFADCCHPQSTVNRYVVLSLATSSYPCEVSRLRTFQLAAVGPLLPVLDSRVVDLMDWKALESGAHFNSRTTSNTNRYLDFGLQ